MIDANYFAAKSWDFATTAVTTTQTLTAGVLALVRLVPQLSVMVTTIYVYVNTGGVTLTSGQNLAGLYDASGNLLSGCGDQSTAWAGTGVIAMTLTTSQALTAGIPVYAGLLFNGTTSPAFLKGAATTAAAINAGTTSTTRRFATYGTGQTALPTVTMSSTANANFALWVALQ